MSFSQSTRMACAWMVYQDDLETLSDGLIEFRVSSTAVARIRHHPTPSSRARRLQNFHRSAFRSIFAIIKKFGRTRVTRDDPWDINGS
jgi:hypothetical protein